jgi:hypothetical protein
MKRTYFTQLIISSTVSFIFICAAAAEDWHFSAAPLFGVHCGTLGEYVFTPDTNGSYQKLSELDWDMKPVWYYGAKISLGWHGFALSCYASRSIPERAGSMYDSDWQNITINSDADTKTNYSISENTLTSSCKLGAGASYTFYLDKYVSVQAAASIDYTQTTMEARNGYGWYADKTTLNNNGINTTSGSPYTSSQAVYYPAGQLSGVDYTRKDMLTWIGITDIITPLEQFTGTLSFFVSPYAYIQSLDIHYGTSTNNYYADSMSGFCSAYRIETSCMYNFTKKFSLMLTMAWIFSGIIRGDDYHSTSESGPWTKVSDVKSGADLNYTETSVSLRYNPF